MLREDQTIYEEQFDKRMQWIPFPPEENYEWEENGKL